MKPILFNTEMVKAILEGRKTVTRRLIKPQPDGKIAYCMAGYKHGTWSYPGDTTYKFWGDEWKIPEGLSEFERNRHWTPPCHTDDVLYVRETWCRIGNTKAGRPMHYCYRADMENPAYDDMGFMAEWRPSIHMPKEAARIFLRVTNVAVKRLQSMTAEDSLREGVKLHLGGIVNGEPTLKPFADLWDSTVKIADRPYYGWMANPWVWVIEFERLEKSNEPKV